MSEDPDREQPAPDAESDEDQPASTPFDNPFFLPAVLWALALWFGWDIVTDAEAYQEYPMFNLGGFAVFSVAAIYFTRSAILEKRAESERKGD